MRLFRCELFQPTLEIVMEPWFVVINEDACGDVHSVHQDETFGDAAFLDTLFDLSGDSKKLPPAFGFEPKFFSVGFHKTISKRKLQLLLLDLVIAHKSWTFRLLIVL